MQTEQLRFQVTRPAENSYLPSTYHRNAATVQQLLLDWFSREGRVFPWRSIEQALGRSHDEVIHDPYLILVSEVMLQQTQTARVVEKLPQFMESFPTVESLADAGRGELLRAWRGLGYNRRALRLQETAQAIIRDHEGRFPSSIAELESLPGVGRYTASAIACFAFGQEVAVVDVNVIRVLSRLFYMCHTPQSLMPETTINRLAEALVPQGDAYRWHQALMDFGAMVCTARRPACERCPLADVCLSAFPLDLALFHPSSVTSSEPLLRGKPRRLWRGRMIEILRDIDGGIHLGELIDRLIGDDLCIASASERRELLQLADVLLKEGLIERQGGVYEGDLQEHDAIGLPR